VKSDTNNLLTRIRPEWLQKTEVSTHVYRIMEVVAYTFQLFNTSDADVFNPHKQEN